VVESYGGISFKPSETVDGPLLHVTAQNWYRSIKVKDKPNHKIHLFFLLTVNPGMILVHNEIDVQFFMYVYFYSVHVSGSHVHMWFMSLSR